MVNKVTLIGRITADIELRTTNSGINYSYFTIAVNRPRSIEQKADFISCVAWRKTADLMAQYLRKGSLIYVEGRLEVYRTENDGKFETRSSVNVTSVQFLESRESSQKRNTEVRRDFDSNNGGVDINFDSQTKRSEDVYEGVNSKRIDSENQQEFSREFPDLTYTSEKKPKIEEGESKIKKEDLIEEINL